MPLLSSLNQKTTLDGTEEIYLDDSSTDKRGLVSAILAYIRQAGAAFVVSTLNKITITQPASGATLTLADGKTLAVQNTLTLAGTDGKTLTVSNSVGMSGTDGTSFAFPGASDGVVCLAAAQTLSNKTLIFPNLSSPVVSGSLKLTSAGPAGGFGYDTGAGNAATQATSKSTTVTNPSSDPSNCGTITLFNDALAAGTTVSFAFTNSAFASTDHIIVSHISGGTLGAYTVCAVAGSGTATFYLRNITAGSLSEAVVLKYTRIRGAVS